MEHLVETIVLGVVQGLTEWLPISSTGHLRLFENFFRLKVPILFDVILHAGTLVVVLIFFRKDLRDILSRPHGNIQFGEKNVISLIVVGTIPTIVVGLIFGSIIEDTFKTSLPIGIAFLLCGALLYLSKKRRENIHGVTFSTAFLIGVAQGVAIIPGISRSGFTIATALLIGIKQEQAFKFSFLLSIPTLLGAMGYTIATEVGELSASGIGWVEMLSGVVVAIISGYFTLKLLWRTLAQGRFHLFAFYCWSLGLLLVLWEIFQPTWFVI
ncbi:MAG: undecaprenyl-diphosphate phosphatase [Candidatus Bathyarchaeota archaeon]